ncbi:MAG TPA: PaaI family thioesterase [Pyrinomonadaceae bacterium]
MDSDFEARVREGFERQQLMASIGAQLIKVAPGEVQIEMPFNQAWTQQHGYIHAAIITGLVDSACGFAAYTLMPADAGVLSVEFKVNLLSPAKGEMFRAVGRVIKSGRTLTVCNGEVVAVEKGNEKIVAVMQATMMSVSNKD